MFQNTTSYFYAVNNPFNHKLNHSGFFKSIRYLDYFPTNKLMNISQDKKPFHDESMKRLNICARPVVF
ncbi:hypothetical protein CBW46_016830 [Paenibacillus xerothermodurans]|uniref:Uncharacterized protein n=1 Tax=Paenibacillus xerothermodurans TaxID=1977292 RepID=A0A2W1NLC7_PAEXE|nr:hypothetical protein CBW46_016830 [Paenibacillus xerothermodurans]